MSRQPVISVVNKSRWSKAEREERMKLEESVRVGSDRLIPPDYLTDRAKAIYNQLAWEMHWCDNLDHQDLVVYAFSWDRVQTLMEKMRDVPDTVVVGTKIIPNEDRYALRNYMDEMRKISARLGIAHADRLRLLQPQQADKPENKFAAFKRNRDIVQ